MTTLLIILVMVILPLIAVVECRKPTRALRDVSGPSVAIVVSSTIHDPRGGQEVADIGRHCTSLRRTPLGTTAQARQYT
jgi:hypothetical protein